MIKISDVLNGVRSQMAALHLVHGIKLGEDAADYKIEVKVDDARYSIGDLISDDVKVVMVASRTGEEDAVFTALPLTTRLSAIKTTYGDLPCFIKIGENMFTPYSIKGEDSILLVECEAIGIEKVPVSLPDPTHALKELQPRIERLLSLFNKEIMLGANINVNKDCLGDSPFKFKRGAHIAGMLGFGNLTNYIAYTMNNNEVDISGNRIVVSTTTENKDDFNSLKNLFNTSQNGYSAVQKSVLHPFIIAFPDFEKQVLDYYRPLVANKVIEKIDKEYGTGNVPDEDARKEFTDAVNKYLAALDAAKPADEQTNDCACSGGACHCEGDAASDGGNDCTCEKHHEG